MNVYNGGVINNGDRNLVAGSNAGAGSADTSYSDCVFIGSNAAANSPVGIGGVVVGSEAAKDRRTQEIVAVGYECNKGSYNNNEFASKIGVRALANLNTTSQGDTAIGYEAMYLRVGGGSNTALGFQSLRNNTGGSSSTVVGALSEISSTNSPTNVYILGAQCDAASGLRNIHLGRGVTYVGTQRLHLGSVTTPLATSATANEGANGAAPAQVAGYLSVVINGTLRKIAYYNV